MKTKYLLLCLGIAIGFTLSTSTTYAVTFNVNTADDGGDANLSDGVCAASTGLCTLRAAVQEANTLSSNDVIELPERVYFLTITGTDNNAAGGDLDIIGGRGTLTINGVGAGSTTIRADNVDRIFHVLSGATVFIEGVAIINGDRRSADWPDNAGGGIKNEGGTLTLERCDVRGNKAGIGGGIYQAGGSTNIADSIIIANQASLTNGGGIYVAYGTFNMVNSTVANNSAPAMGGGISILQDVQPLNATILNSTISGNWTSFLRSSGGGLHVHSSIVIVMGNTIIAENMNGLGNDDCYGQVNSRGYNLIKSANGCQISGITTGNRLDTDPMLGALVYNGGPTKTLALRAGSPAIDAGNPTGCLDYNGDILTSDQRGWLRPRNGRCDIGAFEAGEACGNGLHDAGEACDIAITAGQPGACLISCDDGNSCTVDTLTDGGTCSAAWACSHTEITAYTPGDSCCPDDGNNNRDSDCSVHCGNGVLEAGETCDTGITVGPLGVCQTSCDDGNSCTNDILTGEGTCSAACSRTEISTYTHGDGCCPAGGNNNIDNDCSVHCGNGALEAGETCDTAITVGPLGICQTSCDDDNSCTVDTPTGEGTCSADCSHTTIVEYRNDDNCCPAGGTNSLDSDCPSEAVSPAPVSTPEPTATPAPTATPTDTPTPTPAVPTSSDEGTGSGCSLNPSL